MYTLINDLHFGLKRVSGTTPAIMSLYHQHQLTGLKELLLAAQGTDLIILGDLFDSPSVDYSILWDVLEALRGFKGTIYLVKANHDEHRDRSVMASFDFLCKCLPDAVKVDAPYILNSMVTIIPCLANQDAQDNAVAEASNGAQVLLMHTNFDNPFTQDKDHSLNLTPEQAALFELVISGHEHQKRTVANVCMLGAQWPCNVMEAGVPKFYHQWDGASEITAISSPWQHTCIETDWRCLNTAEAPEAQFIKITGTAEADEAAVVLKEIAAFRTRSNAFMIQNAVMVGKIDLGALEQQTHGDLEKFDALAELLAMLGDGDVQKLKELGVI